MKLTNFNLNFNLNLSAAQQQSLGNEILNSSLGLGFSSGLMDRQKNVQIPFLTRERFCVPREWGLDLLDRGSPSILFGSFRVLDRIRTGGVLVASFANWRIRTRGWIALRVLLFLMLQTILRSYEI